MIVRSKSSSSWPIVSSGMMNALALMIPHITWASTGSFSIGPIVIAPWWMLAPALSNHWADEVAEQFRVCSGGYGLSPHLGSLIGEFVNGSKDASGV